MSTFTLKPIANSSIVVIDDSFVADYTYFKNDETFIRPDNAWTKFIEKDFIAPNSNAFLKDPYDNGVEFGCYEHVSVCIAGNSEYILTTPSGTDEYNWTFGVNNVENGWGYLPKKTFTRVFHNDFATCCIVPKKGRDSSVVYNFEVLQENTTLNRDVDFAHVAHGSVTIDGQVYEQRATINNLVKDTTLSFAGDCIVILGYTI
jgi:hypothetical protein